MIRHTFMLILTVLLSGFYLFTLDYANFQFLDAIIIFMLLFSLVFNVYVLIQGKKSKTK